MSRIQATLLRRATTKEHLEVEYDDFCSKGERYALVRRLLLAELLLKMIHPIFSEEKSEHVFFRGGSSVNSFSKQASSNSLICRIKIKLGSYRT